MLLGYPLCFLCLLSGCNWVLIIVGLFFGGSFLLAHWLRVILPTISCMLLYRYSVLFVCFVFSGSASGDDRWSPHSGLRQPVQDYQGSTIYGWLLHLLIYLLCNQQSGLSTTGWGRLISVGRAIASLRLILLGGEWTARASWLLKYGEWVCTRILVAPHSVLCQSHHPQYLLKCLCSSLPLLCQSPG